MFLYLSAAEYVIKASDEMEMTFHMLSLICLTVVVEAVPIRNLVLTEVVNQMQVSIRSVSNFEIQPINAYFFLDRDVMHFHNLVCIPITKTLDLAIL